jgi:DNA primase catalytic core
MMTEGKSFPEAVESLAERFRIPIEYTDKEKRPSLGGRQDLQKAMAIVHEFFRESLRQAPPRVVDYCHERGLTDDVINLFKIGFAPLDRGRMVTELGRRGISETALLSAGLLRRTNSGSLYELFQGRLIFPLLQEQGEVIAFGGRLIPGLDTRTSEYQPPKYVNSPETPLYKKNSTFYGLSHALKEVRARKEVYIVEGYMDVISLHMAGVTNAVATCGTALTGAHAQRLSHLVKRVITVFDGDNAGREAANKAYRSLSSFPLQCDGLFLEDGVDPDTLSRKYGTEVKVILQSLPRRPLLDSFIDHLTMQFGAKSIHALDAAAKVSIIREVTSLVDPIKDILLRSELLRKISQKLMIDEKVLSSGAVLPQSKTPNAPLVKVNATSDRIDLNGTERDFIRAVMIAGERCKLLVENDALLGEVLAPETIFFLCEFQRIIRSTEASDERRQQLSWLLRSAGKSWVLLWKEAWALAQQKDFRSEPLLEQCYEALRRQKAKNSILQLEKVISEELEEDTRARLIQRKIELERLLRK